MNRPVNSGKRVESIDRVGRFSVELSRFVRLDRFQGLQRRQVNSLTASNRLVAGRRRRRRLFESRVGGDCISASLASRLADGQQACCQQIRQLNTTPETYVQVSRQVRREVIVYWTPGHRPNVANKRAICSILAVVGAL